jgi:hypothetical protein
VHITSCADYRRPTPGLDHLHLPTLIPPALAAASKYVCHFDNWQLHNRNCQLDNRNLPHIRFAIDLAPRVVRPFVIPAAGLASLKSGGFNHPPTTPKPTMQSTWPPTVFFCVGYQGRRAPTGWPHTAQSGKPDCRGPEAMPHQRDTPNTPIPGPTVFETHRTFASLLTWHQGW